jgi:hypothetical protein
MKRKTDLILAVTIALALMFGAVACGGATEEDKYKDVIESINVYDQEANGVPMKNYVVTLNLDGDWDGVGADEQTAIAQYSVEKAHEKAEADGASNYNVLGILPDGTAAFLVDGQSEIKIISGNNDSFIVSGSGIVDEEAIDE